jgi:hypothetical protein
MPFDTQSIASVSRTLLEQGLRRFTYLPLLTPEPRPLVPRIFDSKLTACSSSLITVHRFYFLAFFFYTRDMPTVMLTNACTPLGQVNGATGTTVAVVLDQAGKS